MPGLVPGIHVFLVELKDVDGRDKPGHDEEGHETQPKISPGVAHRCRAPAPISSSRLP